MRGPALGSVSVMGLKSKGFMRVQIELGRPEGRFFIFTRQVKKVPVYIILIITYYQ